MKRILSALVVSAVMGFATRPPRIRSAPKVPMCGDAFADPDRSGLIPLQTVDLNSLI